MLVIAKLDRLARTARFLLSVVEGTLADQVQAYERQHHPIAPPTQAEAHQFRAEQTAPAG